MNHAAGSDRVEHLRDHGGHPPRWPRFRESDFENPQQTIFRVVKHFTLLRSMWV
jgi:hypothetical protein